MTTPDILRKLSRELDTGITTEVQVVYLLVGIRKIIERDKIDQPYAALKFHCDWALHAALDRAPARAVLRHFEAAYPLLKGNVKLSDLPPDLRAEIDRISKMKAFEKELEHFLTTYGLPPLTQHRPDGWIHFLHLYAHVIEDIPLVVALPTTEPTAGESGASGPQHISHVTVGCELARETHKDSYGNEDMFFKVTWNIHDRDGHCGEIFVINSFSLKTE